VSYAYAQNPIWHLVEMLRSPFQFDLHGGGVSEMLTRMPLDQAVKISRNTIAPGEQFPYEQYPFVRQMQNKPVIQFEQQPNVLLIFVEGLDRRFLALNQVYSMACQDDQAWSPAIRFRESIRDLKEPFV
jgi:hypothetical protein